MLPTVTPILASAPSTKLGMENGPAGASPGDGLLHPRHVRVPRLGAEGELAAVPGQPGADPPAGGRGQPRRDAGARCCGRASIPARCRRSCPPSPAAHRAGAGPRRIRPLDPAGAPADRGAAPRPRGNRPLRPASWSPCSTSTPPGSARRSRSGRFASRRRGSKSSCSARRSVTTRPASRSSSGRAGSSRASPTRAGPRTCHRIRPRSSGARSWGSIVWRAWNWSPNRWTRCSRTAGIRWDVRDGHLVVWAGEGSIPKRCTNCGRVNSRRASIGGGSRGACPCCRGEQLLLSQTPVEWDAWVRLGTLRRGAEAPRPPGFPVVVAPAVEDSGSPPSTENSTRPPSRSAPVTLRACVPAALYFSAGLVAGVPPAPTTVSHTVSIFVTS